MKACVKYHGKALKPDFGWVEEYGEARKPDSKWAGGGETALKPDYGWVEKHGKAQKPDMEWGKAIKELGFDCMALAVHRVAYDAPLVHCLPLSCSSTCLMILSR
jgi:hypothetical protein